ncbi:SDR family oxidoreductase [Sorangium sp. So ce260]|uniref:SDR family oxidoreductase n=1 Tax=Sorangium sp. So ce260 TaxID=3133291 RepID=UPI003F5FD0BC
MEAKSHQGALEGRRVVIVGGTSGMGLGAARAAARAGAEVIAAGRRPRAERAAGAPGDAPIARIAQETVDVTDEASVKAMFERTGELDHLLITAAPEPGSWGAFLEQDVAGAQRYMNAKFFGSWACARYAAPRMRAGGSITFLTGGAAVRPRAGASMVSATFAALETLARGLAIELGPLRVNAIRPGYTDSEMWGFLDDEAREQLRRKVTAAMPVRRMGTVEDIGHAAVFLMTNPQVTGSVLEITGGETLVDGL